MIRRECCRVSLVLLLALLLATGGMIDVPDLSAQDVSVRDHQVVTLRQESEVFGRDVATVRDVTWRAMAGRRRPSRQRRQAGSWPKSSRGVTTTGSKRPGPI